MALDELLLLSGNDIPFEEGCLVIHCPKIKEIAYVNEEPFFIGCRLLISSKNFLDTSGKNELDALSNFDIIMMIMKEKNKALTLFKEDVKMVLALLFPTYTFSFEKEDIIFINIEDNSQIGFLNRENFDSFREIITQIFCLKEILGNEEDYNPAGAAAKRIADKFKERHRRLAQMKNQNDKAHKISVFSRYMSILSIGLHISFEELKEYTVYQLFDTFNRYILFLQSDSYTKACLAGATKLKEPEDWMKDLYDKEEKIDKTVFTHGELR